jgi:TolA-binding protein
MRSLKGKIQLIVQRSFLKNKRLQKNNDLLSSGNETNQVFLDITEVKNDDSLVRINPVTRNMVDEFIQNPERYKDQRDFVLKSLNKSQSSKNIAREIDEIKKEINETRIDEITESWIIESLERNQKSEKKNLKAEADREYISEALSSSRSKPDSEIQFNKKNKRRRYTIHFFGLSAAAFIAIFFIIKTLTPSFNAEKIYTKYYRPFNAISSISRTTNGNKDKLYNQGVELYKQGKYQSAAEVFNKVTERDTSYYAPLFFAGITQLELSNYNNANILLSEVIDHSSEFRKEALWYLALSYLKTGEKEKAISYLNPLAGSDGFYRSRARKILRCLK